MTNFEIFTIFSLLVLAFAIVTITIVLLKGISKILDKLENNNYLTIVDKLTDLEKIKRTGVK